MKLLRNVLLFVLMCEFGGTCGIAKELFRGDETKPAPNKEDAKAGELLSFDWAALREGEVLLRGVKDRVSSICVYPRFVINTPVVRGRVRSVELENVECSLRVKQLADKLAPARLGNSAQVRGSITFSNPISTGVVDRSRLPQHRGLMLQDGASAYGVGVQNYIPGYSGSLFSELFFEYSTCGITPSGTYSSANRGSFPNDAGYDHSDGGDNLTWHADVWDTFFDSTYTAYFYAAVRANADYTGATSCDQYGQGNMPYTFVGMCY